MEIRRAPAGELEGEELRDGVVDAPSRLSGVPMGRYSLEGLGSGIPEIRGLRGQSARVHQAKGRSSGLTLYVPPSGLRNRKSLVSSLLGGC